MALKTLLDYNGWDPERLQRMPLHLRGLHGAPINFTDDIEMFVGTALLGFSGFLVFSRKLYISYKVLLKNVGAHL